MIRMKPQINDGEWARVGRKHYRHASGIEIVYRHNEWLWEIVGGRYDGHRFDRLWAAQHHATLA
jgi:hypothetical protein